MDTRDIILGVLGFFISFYGGYQQDLTVVVTGILLIILSVWLKLKSQEDDIRTLQAQINTQNELRKIWREIEKLKNGKKK